MSGRKPRGFHGPNQQGAGSATAFDASGDLGIGSELLVSACCSKLLFLSERWFEISGGSTDVEQVSAKEEDVQVPARARQIVALRRENGKVQTVG